MTHKRFYTLLLAALTAIPGMAQSAQAEVTVNGMKATRALARITFDGDNVVLHFADGSEDVSADMDGVTIDLGNATPVGSLKTLTAPHVEGDRLVIGGTRRGERIALCDATGRRIMQTTAATDTITLSIATLAKGVYVVRTGQHIIKFSKK